MCKLELGVRAILYWIKSEEKVSISLGMMESCKKRFLGLKIAFKGVF